MKYVILRDDDTNALTPIECLEKLYRPFLDKNLPVNLATIPNVCTNATWAEGKPELFLMAKRGDVPKHLPLGSNGKLVEYLKDNSGFHILQHGCRHEFVNRAYEFAQENRWDIASRLDEGTRFLLEAGFPRPKAFVAPNDQLSRTSLEEVSKRFRVLSTGWFELSRLPVSWWPKYALKKTLRAPHWRVGETILLTHPGCHLSYHRSYDTMLDQIKKSIDGQRLTVLVTHWWEYFRDNKPDERFINLLHETAACLARRKDVKVISFDSLAEEKISLN
jgi:predicted deacetylase